MNEKAQLIACEIENLVIQFEEKKYSHSQEELTQLLKENEIINFNQISNTECHVISCIDTIKKANGIIIAEKLDMTRGGISKIANKLIEKNLITTYKDEDNQKKIFYKLTSLGEKINKIHNKLHKENHKNLYNIASNYTSEEQDIILKFINDLKK